uniref:Amphi-Trp domain-containing protein n=1 Tax=Desulfovibrio sp. U5L TaxID=596152 RepID=I2Q1M7_9BACT
MSDKSELFHCDEKMLTYDAAIYLENLVAGLRQGKLGITGEDGPVCIDLPLVGTLEVSFKEKVKPGKSKRKLTIELSWKDKEDLGLEG